MALKLRLTALALALFLVTLPISVALAQGGHESWLSIDMSGVADSYLDIEMTGIAASFLSIATSFIRPILPFAPTSFTITQTGPDSILITWDMGTAANTTVIRGSATAYPGSLTDGYEVYSGNGTSVAMSGFDFDIAGHYFTAWGQNSFGYSSNTARGNVGATIALPALIFAIGLCVFALWKRGWLRILLAICIVIWGAFAVPYDMKIALPLIAVGMILFTISIWKLASGDMEYEV